MTTEKLLHTQILPNSLSLSVYDCSRPMAGDRWQVVLEVRLVIPVTPSTLPADLAARAQEVMAALGAGPRDTLMIGDTEYDLQMARNAGVPGLAVSYGVHAPSRLLAEGALVCLDRIDELPGWLAAQSWPPSFVSSEEVK